MIKKAVSILFILIAGLTFLTDAVVPHHHHDNQICFNISHCQAENNGHHHNTSGHSHDHGCSNGNSDCILGQFTALSSNTIKQGITKVYRTETRVFTAKAFYVSVLKNLNGFQNERKDSFTYPPFLNHYYSEYAVASKGLRAPPVV